tara:strand:+ start:1212 stop:1448 length:237 start_codon:yes stop_codon:yes gene_type:complete
VRYRPKELDPLLQLITFSHLFQRAAVGPVTSYDEVHIWEAAAYLRDDLNQQVRALAPHEPHHHDDVDGAKGSHLEHRT